MTAGKIQIALADVATARVREQLCHGLDELRVVAQEDRADAHLATGRYSGLVTELTELVARHPLRERLVGLLMVALYRSGQQAGALAVCRETRRRLIDELGIEPGIELRRLEQAILNQDPFLHSDLTAMAGVTTVDTAPLDWSHRMLDEDEARLLERLSVFRGDFSAAAAVAVCDADVGAVAALVDRSLIRRSTVDGATRYRVVEAVREYAAAANGAAGRHLDHWLDVVRALDLAVELMPVLHAMDDRHHRLHATVMMAELHIVWGRYGEAAALCARERPADTSSSTDAARGLVVTGLAALGLGDLAGAGVVERHLREYLDRPANYLRPSRLWLVIALRALMTTDARGVIAGIVRELSEGHQPYPSPVYWFRFLLAEAHRRAGDLASARSELGAALHESRQRSDYGQTMSGVLTAALLAVDTGEVAAGKDLAGHWDLVRRRLGLPAPIGYAECVRDVLGLAPEAGAPEPGYSWRHRDLHDLVAHAADWTGKP